MADSRGPVALLVVVPRRSAWLREHPREAAIAILTPPFLPPGLGALRLLARDQILNELRALAQRLHDLEETVRRLP